MDKTYVAKNVVAKAGGLVAFIFGLFVLVVGGAIMLLGIFLCLTLILAIIGIPICIVAFFIMGFGFTSCAAGWVAMTHKFTSSAHATKGKIRIRDSRGRFVKREDFESRDDETSELDGFESSALSDEEDKTS
jgi:hypothetical protein